MRNKYIMIVNGKEEEISATSYNQAKIAAKLMEERFTEKEKEQKDHLSFAERRWGKFINGEKKKEE